MPGKADGISRSQYSPSSSPSSPFLYPNLSPIDFLTNCAPTWPYFMVPNNSQSSLGFLVVAWRSSKVLPRPFYISGTVGLS